jgi:cob(I)alamin adenosyltransferase
MKIYTKTGDSGNTSLFGGKRVDKDNQRIEAYGTLDELNSVIGLILVEKVNDKTRKILTILQQSLFVIGSELATPSDVQSKAIRPLTNEEISVLENYIDEIDADLPSLKNFIIPGGTKSASLLHFARTVCRRAERRIVEIDKSENISKNIIAYINRLSDLLFVIARYENHVTSTPETEWKPRG